MRLCHTQLRPLPIVLALQAIFTLPTYAADITISADNPISTAQALTSTNATVLQGASLIVVSPTSTAAITVNAGTSIIDNSGAIKQTSGGRAIDANAASTTITINNNIDGLIDAIGDVTIRIGKASNKFVINNQGTISQSGLAAGGKRAIKVDENFTTTSNQIINGSITNRSATISSSGDDAIRLGSNTTLTNYGQIFSTGVANSKCPEYLGAISCPSSAFSAADGVAIENGMKNVAILNYGSITGPRHAIDGGDPVAPVADSNLIGLERLIITSADGNGVVFAKVVNGVTTSNVKIINPVVVNYAGGTITGNNGSGVGLDGHGVVINYGTISGQYAGAGNVYDHGGLGLTTNNGDGDGVDIDGVAYIENFGRIQGTGAGGFDSGGSPNGADGIAAGGGTIINHTGATIYGASKGILIDDGSDGSLIPSGRGGTRVTGAVVNISNEGSITGEKKVAIGLVGIYNDTVTNTANGVITGGLEATRLGENNSTAAGAAIQMGAGDDTLTNYGRIEGKNGLAIDMGDGDDTLRLFGGTVIGAVDGGAGINTMETKGTQSFSSNVLRNFQNIKVLSDTLRINGDFSTNNLTVNGILQAPNSGAFRTINITGNYEQAATGVLEARVGENGTSDKLTVTNTATLTNGATIRPLLSGYVADGTTYTLINAGTLSTSVANLKVDSTSNFLSYTLVQDGNDLKWTTPGIVDKS